MRGGALSRRLARIHLYLRGRTESLLTTWPTRLRAFPLATLCFHRLARTTFILFSAVPTALRTAHLQPILWSNFRGKKEAREWPLRPLWGRSRIHLDTRSLRETSLAFPPFFFFSHAERKRYDILFRLFPRFARERVFLWKKNPLAMHRLVSRIFLLRECRKTTYLAIIRERIPLEFLSRYYQWIFNSQRWFCNIFLEMIV